MIQINDYRLALEGIKIFALQLTYKLIIDEDDDDGDMFSARWHCCKKNGRQLSHDIIIKPCLRQMTIVNEH